jgi:hypothetical protein
MINFGDMISKGNGGQVVMLSYPHDPDIDRYEIREEFGLKLSPHCLFRFLPSIGYVSDKWSKGNLVSNLGDVLKPKQFVRHKYHAIKTIYGQEELLENLKDLALEKVFESGKELLFFGSSTESFKTLFESFIVSEDKRGGIDCLNSTPKTIWIFSPFVYLRSHFDNVHIRAESWVRMLLEYIRKMNLTGVKVRLFGAARHLIITEEWECITHYKDILSVIFSDELTPELLSDEITKLQNDTESQKFVVFSFNVVDSSYFWGKSFTNFDSSFDNRACLKMFRRLGRVNGLKCLAFYDFNPQIEDYASGIFYSSLVYEYLSHKFQLENK